MVNPRLLLLMARISEDDTLEWTKPEAPRNQRKVNPLSYPQKLQVMHQKIAYPSSSKVFLSRPLKKNSKIFSLNAEILPAAESCSTLKLDSPKGSSSSNSRFGYIDFKTVEAVKKAIAKDGEDLGGRKLLVDYEQGRPKAGFKGKAPRGGAAGGYNKSYNKGGEWKERRGD